LITRVESKTDRRKFFISISAKGEETING